MIDVYKRQDEKDDDAFNDAWEELTGEDPEDVYKRQGT